MDKTTAILISALAALTAIVAFATKIVEYKSIRAKQKSDAQTPAPVTTISTTSQRKFSPGRALFTLVFRLYCMVYVFYKALAAGYDKPATVGDVAVIGMCIAFIIVTDRTYHDT